MQDRPLDFAPSGDDDPAVPRVDVELETDLSPEQVRAGLTDFSPRRPELWPGISPSLYKVYEVGETSATVQEGTKLSLGSFWAKEHYDWSDPQTVRWTVEESNFCAPGSFVSATLTPRPGGGTRIQMHWERTPTSFLGKFVGRIVVAARGKPVAQSFEKGLQRIAAASANAGNGEEKA